ncbi:nitroreductase family protein [bacterium]|nr:nitroreductase family protein [bacterium]
MTDIEYNNLLELVKKRRSIRRFKSDPVPDEIIDKVMEVARWAPSAFNTQPWEFVILKDEPSRKRIVEITSSYWDDCVDMEKARAEWQGRTWTLKGMTNEPGDYSEAPVYIFLFGDPRTLDALPMGVQCDQHRRRLVYQSSLANAFLYMQLAAASFGLGAQWYSVVQTPYCSCLIKDFLGIPQEFDMYDMMVLGYPAVNPPRKFIRKTEEMVHWGVDNSGSFRNETEIRDFVKKTRSWVTGCHAKKAKEME